MPLINLKVRQRTSGPAASRSGGGRRHPWAELLRAAACWPSPAPSRFRQRTFDIEMVAGPSSAICSPPSKRRFEKFVTCSDLRTTERDSNRETLRTAQACS